MPRVLVVDDDVFALRLCRKQLALVGFPDVVVATSSREALALIDDGATPFDVVLCDLNMPDVDGVVLMRLLAETRFDGAVALMSGEDGRVLDAVARLAREHGLRVAGALRKPYGIGDLRRVLLNVVPAQDRAAPAGRAYAAAELCEAIVQGRIVAAYQPQVSVADGRVVGVEALARWRHPVDGAVLPARFVPLAEAHGLVGPLTDAVLRCVLNDAADGFGADAPLRIAVNVSAQSLGDHGFPDRIAEAAAVAGVDPSRLTVEVTESTLAVDRRRALEVLTRLRLRRIGLAVDDFGQGYATLLQLRDVPFDELKIDRAFVHGAARDAAARKIFEASLALGRDLGLRVVAEGVEDDGDLAFVRGHALDAAQGYAIARPLDAAALRKWLAARPVPCRVAVR